MPPPSDDRPLRPNTQLALSSPKSAPLNSPFSRALVAGALAGLTVDITLYPLDTLKTRLQSSRGFLRSGGFRGIYSGLGSAALGAAPGAALFFVSYEWFKSLDLVTSSSSSATSIIFGSDSTAVKNTRIRKSSVNIHTSSPNPLNHMLAASIGEISACAVRVPTEVVKQRAQAGEYRSSLAALKAILGQRRQIGLAGVWRELYRGWNITILREVPFTVVQFPLWEGGKGWIFGRKMRELKDRRGEADREDRRGRGKGDREMGKRGREEVGVTAFESAVVGSLSGAVAAGVTTPLDVVKTRVMLAREKQGSLKLVRKILREEGWRVFFRGIGPRTVWISVGGFVFLGSYQFVFNALGGS